MTINPKIFKIINDLGLDERESILFCTFWWLKSFYPQAEECLLIPLMDGSRLINLDREEDYRINFLQHDEDSGKLELRYPLFIEDKNSTFQQFIERVAETRMINSLGHVNNPQDYSVFSVNKEAREAFSLLPDFNLEKGVKVLINHYLTTKPAKALPKYLRDNFMVDYKQWHD